MGRLEKLSASVDCISFKWARARNSFACGRAVTRGGPRPPTWKHPMPKSLAQLKNQIVRLQNEAAALEAKERTGVIERIRDAISHYGLTESELFGGAASGAVRRRAAPVEAAAPAAPRKTRRARGAAPAVKKTVSPAKYQDDAGHTWTGVGTRPKWFLAALASGKTPADLLIKKD